jgi:hypothetical protein
MNLKTSIMKRILLLTLSIITAAQAWSQEVDIDWSKPMVCDNKNFGFFETFIGSNSEFVFGKFTNGLLTTAKKSSIRIVAFDKETMKPVKDKVIVGFKSDGAKTKIYDGKTYFDEVVFEDKIMIFWLEYSKKKGTILYAETYDMTFKLVEKMTKVYEALGEKKTPYLRANKKAGDFVLVFRVDVNDEKEKIYLNYIKISSDLNVSSPEEVILPFEKDEDFKSVRVSGRYSLEDNGKFMALCTVIQNNKKLIKNKSKSESFLAEIDVNGGKNTIYNATIDDPSKSILTKTFSVYDGTIYVYGFYRNSNEKDRRGNSGADGVYISKMSKAKEGLQELKFTEFTREFIDELYADDPETQAAKKKAPKKKDKDKDDTGLAWTYEVEQSRIVNNDVIMICTQEYNYSVTTCDSKGNCTTRYYCRKSDVTSIRMNLKGDVVWASNLDRQITYSGWNIPDIELIQRGDKFIVTYGNTQMEKVEGKKKKKSKSGEQLRDEFEYAELDLNSGEIQKETYRVNKPNAEKKDRKSVGARGIQVVDNEMYVNSITTSYDWKKSWLCLIPVCGWYYFALSPNAKIGKGYLGHINVTK